MSRALIVRLLRRSISYRVLWNHIQSLWQPLGRFQLVDLDNEYFKVKFEKEDDYTKVLIDGPWTIFGSYLTVQPWSREFSTSQLHLAYVVVWVRLPGLPIRYYTKNLFRCIVDVIGKVIKADYNIDVGERDKFVPFAVMVDLNKPLLPCVGIDDFTQRLEYEGLHQI
ncbi:hypothetical protein like AT2G01050 [Hibiscus trionum]|uniref:DUF4283 domain-containing protein n=1 Tax=Hibiscus trionum TaxID=183268 RepID=A0A9W7I2B9_HIBTR|nr:hypothetical protein like AT2G01050 [Hibiscus trionum]